VNPVQPTLATECTEAGRFTLNITRFNGSVAIDTGVVQATITRTVFDQNPVAVFAVSKVLLPKEMFGRGNAASAAGAAPPATKAPDVSDGAGTRPAKLFSPPALHGTDIKSSSTSARHANWGCIGLVYLQLHLSLVLLPLV
jgi:hypothetical protein